MLGVRALTIYRSGTDERIMQLSNFNEDHVEEMEIKKEISARDFKL